MNCLKEEIRKILYNKTMIVFMGICTIFNIGLIIATSPKSGEWKKMSENYEYQSGQEIFKDIDGSELGLAYYDERYQKSNTLVAWMHEKYQKLESSLEMLSEQQADLSTYAGELTPYVHTVLFEYLIKALMIEGMLFFSFLVLETFFMEYHNKTAYIVYSSFRGRRTVFDKMSAVLMIGMLFLAVLSLLCYFIFFHMWDFEKIWEANIASSYNYINDYDDPIFMKPFITWKSFTVKQYFCASIVLMIGIWLSWWLISTLIVLVNKKISAAIWALVACLIFPYFGLFLFIVECDVKNYKEFLEYQTNTLNGKEGFDYPKVKEMDETLFADTPYSSIYLQEYEKMMMDYEMASEGCYNVLPDEVIIYSTDFLRYLSLWCLIVVLMVAAPVMVNDVASNMNMEQYSSRIGRKIYKIQYFCTIFSVLLVEIVVIAFGMAVWETTNAFDFGKVGLASFMYPVKPALHITYAEVFGLFMVIMGLMGIGVGSMAFCLSSCSNHVIAMLMKVTSLTVIAGAYILSLENVFYENNLLYGFVHIPGIEMIVAIIIFAAGVIVNIVRYKRIDVRY